MTQWQWSRFDELTGEAMYAMLGLRSAVFVVEQQCVYLDIDGLDRAALHLLGWQQHGGARVLAACLRVLAPGERYAEPSIGRVVTAPFARGDGVGRAMMEEAIRHTREVYPGQPIRISAQSHLERFYGSLGFAAAGTPYDEDGILHVEMLLA